MKNDAMGTESLLFRMNWPEAVSCLILWFHLSSVQSYFRSRRKILRWKNMVILSFYYTAVFVIHSDNRIFSKTSSICTTCQPAGSAEPKVSLLFWDSSVLRRQCHFLFNPIAACHPFTQEALPSRIPISRKPSPHWEVPTFANRVTCDAF